MSEIKSIIIYHDDQADDIIDKINDLLESKNLILNYDDEIHDGYEIIILMDK